MPGNDRADLLAKKVARDRQMIKNKGGQKTLQQMLLSTDRRANIQQAVDEASKASLDEKKSWTVPEQEEKCPPRNGNLPGMNRPRGDIPSPLEIANHPPCYRKVPWSCRSLWIKAVTIFLHKYQQASLDANGDAQVEAVVSLLELPGNVFRYMRADRGRKRNASIQ